MTVEPLVRKGGRESTVNIPCVSTMRLYTTLQMILMFREDGNLEFFTPTLVEEAKHVSDYRIEY